MRPVPIPDDRVWEGGERIVIGPPPDMDIRESKVEPVEVIVDDFRPGLGRRFAILVKLEEGDLDAFARDPHFWLVMYGNQLQPFDVVMPDGHAGMFYTPRPGEVFWVCSCGVRTGPPFYVSEATAKAEWVRHVEGKDEIPSDFHRGD
jgi:hypothetical protein